MPKKTYNEKQLLKYMQDRLEELGIIELTTGIDRTLEKQECIDTIQNIINDMHYKDPTLYKTGLLRMHNIDF